MFILVLLPRHKAGLFSGCSGAGESQCNYADGKKLRGKDTPHDSMYKICSLGRPLQSGVLQENSFKGRKKKTCSNNTVSSQNLRSYDGIVVQLNSAFFSSVK